MASGGALSGKSSGRARISSPTPTPGPRQYSLLAAAPRRVGLPASRPTLYMSQFGAYGGGSEFLEHRTQQSLNTSDGHTTAPTTTTTTLSTTLQI
eukprot:756711-Hanusia_phi.AAC.8